MQGLTEHLETLAPKHEFLTNFMSIHRIVMTSEKITDINYLKLAIQGWRVYFIAGVVFILYSFIRFTNGKKLIVILGIEQDNIVNFMYFTYFSVPIIRNVRQPHTSVYLYAVDCDLISEITFMLFETIFMKRWFQFCIINLLRLIILYYYTLVFSAWFK